MNNEVKKLLDFYIVQLADAERVLRNKPINEESAKRRRDRLQEIVDSMEKTYTLVLNHEQRS